MEFPELYSMLPTLYILSVDDLQVFFPLASLFILKFSYTYKHLPFEKKGRERKGEVEGKFLHASA